MKLPRGIVPMQPEDCTPNLNQIQIDDALGHVRLGGCLMCYSRLQSSRALQKTSVDENLESALREQASEGQGNEPGEREHTRLRIAMSGGTWHPLVRSREMRQS